MTIVANGRHLAVWVNGVQATDWTDERPTSDNARKGCCLEKGAISLQGHEAPVEDLEFRDIRIEDLRRHRRTRRSREAHPHPFSRDPKGSASRNSCFASIPSGRG